MEDLFPTKLVELLKKQKYHIVGRHSAIKKCRWLHEALTRDRSCYKQKFYGIRTHQCIQMTPALYYCTQQCLFCWRAQSSDLKSKWKETKPSTADSPEKIVEGSIKEHLRILTGYKANPKTDQRKFREALTPKHVAISLTGEPTLYEHIGGLIKTFNNKRFTTFLVTNGTVPSALAKLDQEPTQLYISACAPDKENFDRVCRPKTAKAWEKLNKTLELLPSFSCPTVIRITLARSLNMKNIKGYARLVCKANPTYIEPKAYMHVGFSRLRLNFSNMPSHKEIKDFGTRLARESGYNLIEESEESRVVLLSRLRESKRFGDG